MQTEYLICSDGKKRKAVRINCKSCGKEHLSRIGKRRKNEFCSKECRTEFLKSQRVDVPCAWCNNQIQKSISRLNSKSGLYFCNRKCKDAAQKIGGIKEIMPAHFGTAKIADYRSLFTDEELVCSRCGYNEFKSSVQIHHKDENRENNAKENLEPLCANCHMGLHNGEWK